MTYDIKKMVADQIDKREWLIEFDEVVDYKRLIDPVLLEATTLLEQLYIFERTLALMASCGEIELQIAGVNDEGLTLYQRIS